MPPERLKSDSNDQKISHLQHGDFINSAHRRQYIWLASLEKSGGTIFIPQMEHTIESFLGYDAALPRAAN